MRYYPFFADLRDAEVLIVGGGEAAAQKMRLMLKTEARLHFVAPAVNAEIAAEIASGRARWSQRDFRPADVSGAAAVFAAAEDRAAGEAVARAARALGVPVNVVDQQDLCSFITPAIVDRDPVTVAISTEGTAPVLGRRIRAQVEQMLPRRLGDLARFAGALRGRVGAALTDGGARRRFWTGFFDGPIADRFLAGDRNAAAKLADWELSKPVHRAPARGMVALVGAGPGAADLLTLRAQRWLQRADVLVIDRLVEAEIVEMARRDARRIYVGKAPGAHSTPQEEINRIIVEEASAGQTVVRLKGGDPMVFGRAAEELDACAEAGIETVIVPGVTAALACAADARIGVTRREESRSVTFLTGRTADGEAEHDWAALARPGQTLAFYMSVGAAPHIEARLLGAGLDPATPLTIVEKGGRTGQRVVVGAARDLSALVEREAIAGPAIIYIGAHPLPAVANAKTPDRAPVALAVGA